MHSIKTVRIKHEEIARKKKENKLRVIKGKLQLGQIHFYTDKMGTIIIKQPYEAFKCVKTNDIVIKQGSF